ncbi:hypothetical protein ND748_06540, partial [Frankia sp. AiPs1]|uniref:hypothetical protein n=1 Tax=Frankia sp. AiPs1 TaxID=573493 RepID=UPI002043F5F4
AMLGAGCAGAAAWPGAAAAPASPPALINGAALHLPLDRFLQTPPQAEAIARAYRLLLAQCMDRFGIADPPREVSPDEPATLNERRYGITDPVLASKAGYRVSTRAITDPPARPAPPTGSSDPRTLDVLTGQHGQVLQGRTIPAEGCSGEAKRRLTAGAPAGTDISLAERLSQDSYFRSARDRRVQAVFEAWSACMRTRDMRYPTPLGAAADPRFRRGPVSTTEIAVAASDIDCKKKTNLVGVWFTVESELQRPVLVRKRDALDRVRRTNEAELKVARSLGLA